MAAMILVGSLLVLLAVLLVISATRDSSGGARPERMSSRDMCERLWDENKSNGFDLSNDDDHERYVANCMETNRDIARDGRLDGR